MEWAVLLACTYSVNNKLTKTFCFFASWKVRLEVLSKNGSIIWIWSSYKWVFEVLTGLKSIRLLSTDFLDDCNQHHGALVSRVTVNFFCIMMFCYLMLLQCKITFSFLQQSCKRSCVFCVLLTVYIRCNKSLHFNYVCNFLNSCFRGFETGPTERVKCHKYIWFQKNCRECVKWEVKVLYTYSDLSY
jgi:hypothetical protein